jgi:hypothetical protein
LKSCPKPREDFFVHLLRTLPFKRLSCQNSMPLCMRRSGDKSKPPDSFVKNSFWKASKPDTKITCFRMYLPKA